MSDEHKPIHEPLSDEMYVLRRVHKDYFKPGNPIEILPAGFRPNSNDTEGISVSFAGEITPLELASAQGKDPNNYCVVRLRIGDLRALGLSVSRDARLDAPPGHAFVPELNWMAYREPHTKRRLKAIQLELAQLASHAIVHHPG